MYTFNGAGGRVTRQEGKGDRSAPLQDSRDLSQKPSIDLAETYQRLRIVVSMSEGQPLSRSSQQPSTALL